MSEASNNAEDAPRIELEDVKRLRLNPGDTLVITASRSLNLDEASRIREVVRDAFPGHKCLILAPDFSLEVVESA
jgi:hypothetical protein